MCVNSAMDEEGFRIKVRPEPKEMRPGPPALLKLVRRIVLKEVEDYVILEEAAKALQSPREKVGRCMAMLVKEGLLTGLQSLPKGEEHKYCGHTVVWKGGVWAVKPQSWEWTGMRKDPRQAITKKERVEYDRKNPLADSGWDGRAHYVVRGAAFRAAARSEGLLEDPAADWKCACGAVNRFSEEREFTKAQYFSESSCKKCHEPRFPKPSEPDGPPAIKPLICGRCGAAMDMRRKRGRKLHPDHGLRKCNVNVVTGVMED